MQTQIDNLLSTLFKVPFYWAKDNLFRTLILLAGVYIFIFPLVQWLQDSVKQVPYIKLTNSLGLLIITFFSVPDFIILFLIGIIFLLLFYIIKELFKNKIVKDSFNHDLNLWSIPFNAGWNIEKCIDENGNMLSIANSNTPGILKATHNWYDYQFSFWTKITEKNFVKFVIRAENGSNGIVFELNKGSLKPYFLYNSKQIFDEHNESKFSLTLSENTWFKVSVRVAGNDVEVLTGKENKTHYKIIDFSAGVENNLLTSYGTPLTIEDLRKSNKKYLELVRKAFALDKEANEATSEQDKAEKVKKASDGWGKVPYTTRVTLDYSKGSVGFMANDKEKIFIRKVEVRKI